MSLDQIRQPQDTSAAAVASFTATAHPIDLAHWLAPLPLEDIASHLTGQPEDRRAEVFENLPLEVQLGLARHLPRDDLAQIVTVMDADDRVDFFNELSPVEQDQLAETLPQEDREDIRQLSEYPEESAGAIMTSDFATLAAEMTAEDAIASLRQQAPGTETIYRSYVIDHHGRLTGSVRLHALILAEAGTEIRSLMEPTPVSVSVDTDQEDVGKLIARYDLLAIPVLDEDGRLMGIVTHDDAADVMQAETTEDFQKLSTVRPFTQSLRDASLGMLYSKRIVWLALLVFGNLFSGAGIAYFEEMILAYVSLVFFLPLLIDSSGNAGAQSATLMVRALATGDVKLKDWPDLILRELAVAAALGATMAAVVFPLGIWRGGTEIALTVGVTMFAVVLIGSLVGMSLPFLLSRLKLDPATASGPLVTTIADATGVVIYFSVATAILTL
ncbi:magnesium transporter [Pararhodobacter oceanensis]|uniref:magnesium transporter n=1 Tax=Pararhodobacter oceanensis TaxID=2172121 RepID=UPI003A944CFA